MEEAGAAVVQRRGSTWWHVERRGSWEGRVHRCNPLGTRCSASPTLSRPVRYTLPCSPLPLPCLRCTPGSPVLEFNRGPFRARVHEASRAQVPRHAAPRLFPSSMRSRRWDHGAARPAPRRSADPRCLIGLSLFWSEVS